VQVRQDDPNYSILDLKATTEATVTCLKQLKCFRKYPMMI